MRLVLVGDREEPCLPVATEMIGPLWTEALSNRNAGASDGGGEESGRVVDAERPVAEVAPGLDT